MTSVRELSEHQDEFEFLRALGASRTLFTQGVRLTRKQYASRRGDPKALEMMLANGEVEEVDGLLQMKRFAGSTSP